MKAPPWSRIGIGLCAVAALGAGDCVCDPPTSPELVTITGIVLNIDTARPAAGVRVRLLGSIYSSTTPTGTDGLYRIQVPKEAPLLLYTDDFSERNDAWFPFINVDMPTFKAGDLIPADRDFWLIHSCPQTSGAGPGSVALWDEYLANDDDALNGNMFAPTSSAASGGIIAIVFAGCENSRIARYDSMRATTNLTNSPMAYIKNTCFGGLDPFGESSCFYPSSHGVTDSSGAAFSFIDPSAGATSTILTFEDLEAGRSLLWPPFEVPVRAGTISLVWAVGINGVANKYFKEAALCAGLLGPTATSRRPAARYP